MCIRDRLDTYRLKVSELKSYFLLNLISGSFCPATTSLSLQCSTIICEAGHCHSFQIEPKDEYHNQCNPEDSQQHVNEYTLKIYDVVSVTHYHILALINLNVTSQRLRIFSRVTHHIFQNTSFIIVQTLYIYLQNYPNGGAKCLYCTTQKAHSPGFETLSLIHI